MKLTSKMIKEAAAKFGHGGETIVGIANIERFKDAPQSMHPKNIFPDCKSVISIVQPIPRGTYRGITEGTHWSNYTYYSYNRLNTLFRPMVTFPVACMIEDMGFEAVPVYPGVPERVNINNKTVPGRPQPDININVRIAGVACGLGEIGWSKVFIHPKYGPRVRLGTILTDAELEPDPLIKPGTLCKRCMKCVKQCPGGAIPKKGERPPIKITIDGQDYEWGDVHMGRCTATHHGMNREASPFFAKMFPGFEFDVRNSNISEETAYKMAYTLAQGKWVPSHEFPTPDLNPFYQQIMAHTGYFAICGAKGCIRACMEFQEKTDNIDQSGFETPVFSCEWKLPPASEDETGGIAEAKFPEANNYPDHNAGGWK